LQGFDFIFYIAIKKNFEEKNLRRMMQFAEQFTDTKILVTLSRQLSWSHFLVLILVGAR